MDAESTPPSPGRPVDASIAEAAAVWLARCDRGLTPAETRELERWRAADPRHAVELDELQASWSSFDVAAADPDLAREAAELDRATRRKARPAPAWVFVVGAAAATVAMVVGLVAWQHTRLSRVSDAAATAANYRVIESTARRVLFADGSFAEVRGDSEVRAEYTAAERTVRLVRGEAHFSVEKDSSRPFLVAAGETAVRAVGTSFNVRLEAQAVEVLVTEGTVQVADRDAGTTPAEAPPLVTAGERAVVARRPAEVRASVPQAVEVSAATAAELERALAWQSKRLVFDRTPLQDAIDAFNRHADSTAGLQIVLGDEGLRARRLGGTFRAQNAEAFVRLLEQSVEVRAERRENRIVLFPVR